MTTINNENNTGLVLPDIDLDFTYVFRLYTDVSVVTNITSSSDKRAILKSYDLNDFVGVGDPDKDNFREVIDVSETNDIKSFIYCDNQESSRRLWFRYYRDGLGKPKRILYATNIHSGGVYSTFMNRCDLIDDTGNTCGRLIFTSDISMEYNLENTDPTQTPFHFKQVPGGSDKYTIYFNTNEISTYAYEKNGGKEIETKEILNGGGWMCYFLIIDAENPYFNINPEIKTLDLPSVYKPFYMRSLVLVDNNTLNTRVVGNIYNGVGIMNDGKYEVGILSVTINDTDVLFKITRSMPTLLSDYDGSVSTFSSYEVLSGGANEYFRNAVSSLSDVKIILNMEESTPSDSVTFLPSTLFYGNTVSFYKISYAAGLSGQTFVIDLNNESFKGTSSNNVKYFFVSEHFWKKIYNKEDEENYVMNNIMCNKLQEYELNPHKRTPSDSDNNFLSVYGTIFFGNYAMYAAYVGVAGEYAPDPSENSIMIQIDTDSIINGTVSRTFNFFRESEWLIIGITDPLINLLDGGNGVFSTETKDGTILPPHKDFVTIMTIAKPSNINDNEGNT